ncbi:hypothetical protein CHS0354_004441 [Potamilus streckersoni]|uniref:Uncharacterized protein n=1 Tax=Potamilus streckersoni TaxID=2493646 RepID=A0AAE0SP13_9BIVA|nr:hypothetical protein CHS0354_004441 [Potamilus streckersoni]
MANATTRKPAKGNALQVPEKPTDLPLEATVYEKNHETQTEERAINNKASVSEGRRGSNASLTRHNSLPYLMENDFGIENSFEDAKDDIRAPFIKYDPNMLSPYSVSPVIHRRMYKNSPNCLSATPTPPSSPRSRRSVLSFRDSPSPDKPFTTSTFSTPKLLRRRQNVQNSLSIESSNDSLDKGKQRYDMDGKIVIPLSEENVESLEKKFAQNSDMALGDNSETMDTLDMASYPPCFEFTNDKDKHSDVTDSQEKCERWLRTLHIAKMDKIKSVSYTHLPPI